MRAEQAARAEAERRVAAEREAAQLAIERMNAETKARETEEARVAAERQALDAAREQVEANKSASREAEATRERLEREQAEAQSVARELIALMSQKREELGEWRVRAEAVLAEAPPTISRERPNKRWLAALLGGIVLVAGVTAAMTWRPQDPSASTMLAQNTSDRTTVQATVPQRDIVHVDVAEQASKLQMAYQLTAQSPLDHAVDTSNAASASEKN